MLHSYSAWPGFARKKTTEELIAIAAHLCCIKPLNVSEQNDSAA